MREKIKGRVVRARACVEPAAPPLPEVRELVDGRGERWTVYWTPCEPTADHSSFHAPQLGLPSRTAPAIRSKARRRFPYASA